MSRLIKNDFDIDSWLAPEYLEEAKQRLDD